MLARWSKALEQSMLDDIDNIATNAEILEPVNFNARAAAIDYLEFHLIDRLAALAEPADTNTALQHLQQAATTTICRLEEINTQMFYALRTKIAEMRPRGDLFKKLIDQYLGGGLDSYLQPSAGGYNNLDILLNGLLSCGNIPPETIISEPGMVYYQKTPARIVFEMIKKAGYMPGDVFFDLGSGLGQVAILVNLLTGMSCCGIEWQPAYCDYATACAASLNLNDTRFIHGDARYADYSRGTIFFLYTPCQGSMLTAVLENLRREAGKRKIKIFSYGPCTDDLVKKNWLENTLLALNDTDSFGGFNSS
jgi:SAM-dependent methyltransferase